ncbi:MAG: hypothetical protein O7161_00320 [Wolbachia endosymbiont of Halictus tumulorum]|nr:hypothetical protein [Wolbachia endosymbiont of Halictus tumulorum]
MRRAITDEMIKNYIENHSKKEDKFGKSKVSILCSLSIFGFQSIVVE